MIGIRALLVRNLSIQGTTEAVALACGLASAAILSSHLGLAGFGAFNYAFAFMYFFLTLSDLGLTTIGVRDVARAPERASAIFGALHSLRLVIATVVLLIAWVAIGFWPMEPSLRRPLALFSLIVPLTALNTPALMFQTAMRFELAAASIVTSRVLGLVGMIALVWLGRGVTALLGALLVAEVAGLIVTWRLSRRLVRIPFVVDFGAWRAMLRDALPLAVGLIMVAVLNRIDFIMIEQMLRLEDVGQYGAAYRVTNMLEKFPILVMATIFPIMSRLAVEDRRRLREVYARARWRLASVGLVMTAASAIAAPWLMTTLFGESFRAAAVPLRWLVIATACLYLAMLGGNLLIALGHARDNAISLAVGAAANVLLNLVLIPARGIEGAAIATVASTALVLVFTQAAVARRLVAEEQS
ncbi:MAG: flippase [Acidobacteria bacterium]|nr:flippase [Acidobacteriota bacterium]